MNVPRNFHCTAILCLASLTILNVTALTRGDDGATQNAQIEITIERGPDRGQNFGSLWEAVDTEGHVVAGAGFLGSYNTRPRSDRDQLHVFVRGNKEADWKIERLPTIDSPNRGFYPFSMGSQWYVVGRGGPDGTVYRWDEAQQQWSPTDDVSPYAESVAGKSLTVTATSVMYDGRRLLDLSDSAERLGEHYIANGYLVLRRSWPEAQPTRNRLVVYRWAPEDEAPLKEVSESTLELSQPQEFVYAFGQWHDHVLAVTNFGAVLRFDGDQWSILRNASPGTSYQIYTALNYYDRLLLGHYPSGEIYEYAGDDLKPLPGWPPRMAGVSASAREAQTLTIYGGDLYAGIWPWGEVWRYDRDQGRWEFVQRMFKHPETTDQWTHPYEKETAAVATVANLWGQRVTGLLPFGRDLMITTSSKSGTPWEPRFAFLAPDKHNDYGAVYRATVPGHLTVSAQWTAGPTRLKFALEGAALKIYQDGNLLGTLPLDGERAARLAASRVAFGFGVYGPLRAKMAERRASLNVSEVPASFRGTYLHPEEFFKPESSQEEQRLVWRDVLDTMQRAGLNVIMPYFTGSSGQAYCASRLLPKQVYAVSDPMRVLMQEARSRGVLVYPVVCVAVCGHEQPAGILLEHPEWALRQPDGRSLGYISPANPTAREWLASVVREIAADYCPDGIVLDYIRYHNRPLRLDARAEERFRASLPKDCSPEQEAERLQTFKETELTHLVRQIRQSAREQLPGLQLGAYVWGPYTVKNHLTAQVWPRWLDHGYLDLVNVSGYYYPDNNGTEFLNVFQRRLSEARELSRRSAHPVPVTFALGISTSHGRVSSADDIRAYLRSASKAGVDGFALFTWHFALPYLEELTRKGDLSEFPVQETKQ